MAVNVRICKLYTDTLVTHATLAERAAEFIKAKNENHLAAFGSSDTHFVANGPIGQTGLKLKHAHLNQDVSIIYRLHGNPATLDLYGLFSHKESGTGNTGNIKTQRSLATKLSNQEF
jgi:hypothetical protein